MTFWVLMPEINALNMDSKFQKSREEVVMNKDKEQILEKVLLPLFLQEDKKGILLLFFFVFVFVFWFGLF